MAGTIYPEMESLAGPFIRRLLTEARAAEQIATRAKDGRHRTVAAKYTGKASAYYHAARLLGWRPFGEGDTPSDHPSLEVPSQQPVL